LALIPPKLDSMRSTELARRFKADADLSLKDLSSGKTARKFGQVKVWFGLLVDYVRAIQEERKVLIKVMMKAREEYGQSDAKVKGRFLFINNERYDSKSIPEYLTQP